MKQVGGSKICNNDNDKLIDEIGECLDLRSRLRTMLTYWWNNKLNFHSVCKYLNGFNLHCEISLHKWSTKLTLKYKI